ISVASAGNDHRLGANEAPPAIMSVYLGDELHAVLQSIKDGKEYDTKKNLKMTIGVDVLPPIPKDSTDRNRTSPFAFTGNKFEFRSVGSSLSIAGPNTTLNSIVAYALKEFADELEGASDFNTALQTLIKREINAHWRILFNGNGYDASWVEEAKKRGLLNLRTLPDAMEHYLDEKNIKLYTEMGVYTETEMHSHYEIKLQKYCQVLNIEVGTMLEMIYKDIIPAAFKYIDAVSKSALHYTQAVEAAVPYAQKTLLMQLSALVDALYMSAEELAKKHNAAKECGDILKVARSYAEVVLPHMEATRTIADQIEPLLGEEYKPFPSYEDLLFVKS
ncbi:MAG TPA: glutamine synthetase type III, partial [Treponema sp.]|nr:glutamine synthetase type III [Treponema sp.]